MFFPEFDSDVVNSWIEECAANVVNPELYEQDEFIYECVLEETQKYIYDERKAIALFAHYGVHNYMGTTCECNLPDDLFIDDIWNRAKELLAENE